MTFRHVKKVLDTRVKTPSPLFMNPTPTTYRSSKDEKRGIKESWIQPWRWAKFRCTCSSHVFLSRVFIVELSRCVPALRRVANDEETRRRVGAMSDFGTAESVASFTRTPRRRRRRTRARTRGRPSCRRTWLGCFPSGSLGRGIVPRCTIMRPHLRIRRHPRNQSRHSA